MGHHLKTNLTSYRRNRKARQKAKKLAPPPLESSGADSNASNEVTETSIEKTPQTSPKTYSASSPAPDKSTCNSTKGSKPRVFYQYETDPLYLKFCEYNLLDYRLNKYRMFLQKETVDPMFGNFWIPTGPGSFVSSTLNISERP